MNAIISVQTGSRLHFGLLAFGCPERRQYGGLGLMIERPTVRLELGAAQSFTVRGACRDRVCAFAEAWARSEHAELPAVELVVTDASPSHAGLGSGTQLGLAVAAALFQFVQGRRPAAVELAASVGRGLRSSVGTFGFDRGGLIYEDGKLPGELAGRFRERVELPDDWRLVLMSPQHASGLSGEAEVRAFREQLPAVPLETTERLERLLHDRVLPAARASEFQDFGESLYEYGREAGLCFAACQGGPYASPQLERIVAMVRKRGYAGVGQSSWGPTLFAFVDSPGAAREFCAWFERDSAQAEFGSVGLQIAAIANHGARVVTENRLA
ncbi:MAG: hypothetical protein KDA92_07590 [Planctomycetales bacterium]|nr:hypothetical protein [Planctomycetales bacterium]